jgi:glucose/arabinose dehydrogenase
MQVSSLCDRPDKQPNEPKATTVAAVAGEVNLPEPYATKSVYNFSNDVYGRPVGVAVTRDGSLLVAEDAGNVIWRVNKP